MVFFDVEKNNMIMLVSPDVNGIVEVEQGDQDLLQSANSDWEHRSWLLIFENVSLGVAKSTMDPELVETFLSRHMGKDIYEELKANNNLLHKSLRKL